MRAWAVLIGGLIACNPPVTPNLSTTEQLAVVIGPPSASFGAVTINQTSAPVTFTVSPAGSGESDQTITSIVGCDGFEINAPGVPGAVVFKHCTDEPEQTAQGQNAVEPTACPDPRIQTYSFTAAFAPKVTGDLSCTAEIVMNNGTQTFRMDGVGKLPLIAIDVRPRNVNFGDIRVGDISDVRDVTITNAGSSDLDITAAFVGDAEITLIKGKLGMTKVPTGISETFQVQCQPVENKDYAAMLSIDSLDPVNPKITVPIGCHGITSDLSIAPSSLNAVTLVDQDGFSTITLVNEGDADGTIKTVEFGPGTHPDVSFDVRPAPNKPLIANLGSSEEIRIKYRPTTALTAAELGTVVVEFDADAPRTIVINGEAKLAKIASNPPKVAFGRVCAKVATPGSVEVLGTGDAEFIVRGATTDAPFAVTPLSENRVIAPNGQGRQGFVLSVTPDEAAEPTDEPTEITGTLKIQNDAPLQDNFEILMTAVPLPAGITTTEELSLGAAAVDEFTPAQPVEFTNCSDTAVMIAEEPRILGDNADEFRLSRAFQPIMVDRAATIELDVVFAPKARGQRVAEMEIVYTGGRATVALVGDAVGELDRRDSYYACSTGSDAAWPIGVVVIVIARRRRRR